MRRIGPAACPPRVHTELTKRQALASASPSNVDDLWNAFRKLKSYGRLSESLAKPLGARKRCAYCSDSRAADVEHFRPKSMYPTYAFTFENMLLICTECNRRKWTKFPLDARGVPKLINPYFDDPWDVFRFMPLTGYLDSRIIGFEDGAPVRDSRGEATLDVLGEILNSGPLLQGRRDNWQRLLRCLQVALQGSDPLPTSRESLWAGDDDFGLGDYILDREGKEEPDILAWRDAAPSRWGDLRVLPR
ncbi:hypothetical protein GCM10009869_03760 [Amnibacterium kyonggiense]